MEKPIAFSFGPQKINNTIEKENTLNYDLKEKGKTITFSFEPRLIGRQARNFDFLAISPIFTRKICAFCQ